MRCGSCKEPVTAEDAEVCWWCHGSLCYDCWDKFGHCGHAEAEAENQRAIHMFDK